MNTLEISFGNLIDSIQLAHKELAAQADRSVNLSLTVRNWLIGCYIAEYELQGSDRAQYGDNLLSELAKHLAALEVSNCNRRQLYRYLRFYRLYPEIVGTLSAQSRQKEHDDPGRQSAHRNTFLHPVRLYAGGIRTGWHE